MAVWQLVIIICIAQTYAETITPTLTNSTGEYYIISQSSYANFSEHTITCVNPNLCHIICDKVYGCQNSQIYASNAHTLVLDCDFSYSCWYLDIIAPPQQLANINSHAGYGLREVKLNLTSVDTVNINCISTWACLMADFDFSFVNDFNLYCDGRQSCHSINRGISVVAENSPINSVNVWCGGGNQACFDSDWNFENTVTINMNCTYSPGSPPDASCGEMDVRANHAQNVFIDGTTGRYAFQQTTFHVDSAHTVQMDFSDKSGDDVVISGRNIQNSLTVNCGSNGCRGTSIIGTNIVNKLNLNCLEFFSCSYSVQFSGKDFELTCPSNAECNIDCPIGYSVYRPTFTVPTASYAHLNLFCEPTQSTSCGLAEIKCSDTQLISNLVYDSNTPSWNCDSNNCCPDFGALTGRPTRSPITNAPTLSPVTKQPTISPITKQPSVSPVTSDPSLSPSKNPSVSPTTNPSLSPITKQPSRSPITDQPSVSPAKTTIAPTEAPFNVGQCTIYEVAEPFVQELEAGVCDFCFKNKANGLTKKCSRMVDVISGSEPWAEYIQACFLQFCELDCVFDQVNIQTVGDKAKECSCDIFVCGAVSSNDANQYGVFVAIALFVAAHLWM